MTTHTQLFSLLTFKKDAETPLRFSDGLFYGFQKAGFNYYFTKSICNN